MRWDSVCVPILPELDVTLDWYAEISASEVFPDLLAMEKADWKLRLSAMIGQTFP